MGGCPVAAQYTESARNHLLAAHTSKTGPSTSLYQQLPAVDEGLLNVVHKMVSLDAYAHRPSARELLDDPYFEGLEAELGPIVDGPRFGASLLQVGSVTPQIPGHTCL